jgi:hypothetical protein
MLEPLPQAEQELVLDPGRVSHGVAQTGLVADGG